MLGVSGGTQSWLAAVGLVVAVAVLGMAACAAVMPGAAPGKAAGGKAVHATPVPQYYPHMYLPYPSSILLTTYSADVVAHVKLKSVGSEVEHSEGSYWWPVVSYEFEALEYLKGSGGDTIRGLVFVEHPAQSEEAARELAARYVQLIDPLHTGEAVVFMEESFQYLPSTERKDHYYLGAFYIDWFIDSEATNPSENYSLAGLRHWLPLASSEGVSGASGEEAQFMLRHPDGNSAGYYPEDISNAPEEVLDAAGAPGLSVIGLSELRRIAKNELGLLEQTRYPADRVERRAGMAAQNLTAEVVGDAIVLRWDVKAAPSALGGVKGYRVFRQSSVEGNPDFAAPGRVESELVKLADAAPADARMSYEDRAGVSAGATYIYRVWTLEEDVYVFGEYGAEARVAIAAADGATAAGGVVAPKVNSW